MKNRPKPKVSVLTPTWNRAEYLRQVWAGLDSQTYREFEWIVANDGSSDDTIEVIENLASQSNFPITLITASTRIGKSRMDNEAVRAARGEFILWCDSDDYLFPNALETLIQTWESIPIDKRENFAGVTALCETETGALGTDYPKLTYNDINLNKLLLRIDSDLVIFTRAELLKENPFLEVDFLIDESSVWNAIGLRNTRFIPRVLERKNYGEIFCLSNSGLMEYNRGRAYAIILSNRHISNMIGKKEQIRRAINFIRYCFHGDINYKTALSIWNESKNEKYILFFLFPLSYILTLKDRFEGKVRKTHIEFLTAQAHVKIRHVTFFNNRG